MPAGKPPSDIDFRAAGVSVALSETKLASFPEPGKDLAEMPSRDPGGKGLTDTSPTEAALSTFKKGDPAHETAQAEVGD